MAAVRRIVLSDLAPSEKERFYEFLLANKVEFLADPSSTGNYVATIRVVPPAPEKGSRQKQTSSREPGSGSQQTNETRHAVSASQALDGPRDLGGPNITGRGNTGASVAPPPLLVRRYSRFCEALFPPASVPKARGVSQLLRFVDEVYDARFARDAARVRSEATGELNLDDNSRPAAFPDFVVDFAAKKYGLKRLVNQSCWDMAYSVDQLRPENPGVELFGRFLEESFDTADLLFFLFARSVAERELAQVKARGIKGVATRPTAMELDARQCVNVTRIIFGGEQPQLQDTMLQRLDSEMLKLRGTGPEPVLEVNTFLGIATTEYHAMRGETGGTAGAANVADVTADHQVTPVPSPAQNQKLHGGHGQHQLPLMASVGNHGVAFGNVDVEGHEQVEGMARHLLDSLDNQGHSSVDMRQVYDWAGQIVSRRRDLRREARNRWAALEPDQEPGASPGSPGLILTGAGSPGSPAAVGDQGLGDVERYLRSINRYRNEIREHQEGLNRDMTAMSNPAGNLNEVPQDITAMSGEEFEEDLEANIRRILQRATEELAGHTIKSMVSLEDLGPRTVATLRAALAEEFSPQADLLMEALVAQDFDLWLARLGDPVSDEAMLIEHHEAFDELQAEFKGVLSRDISVESVWRICIQLTSTESFAEALQKRAGEMLESIPQKKFTISDPRRFTESSSRSSEKQFTERVSESSRVSSPEATIETLKDAIQVDNGKPMGKDVAADKVTTEKGVVADKVTTEKGAVARANVGDSAGYPVAENKESAAIVQRGSFSANPLLVGPTLSDGPSAVDTSALERRLSQKSAAAVDPLERRLSQLRGETELTQGAPPQAQGKATPQSRTSSGTSGA